MAVLQSHSRILVVDDSATARKIVRRLLHALGFHDVREARDGIGALVTMKKQEVDLVISDWEMAPIDGFALLKLIRRSEQWRNVPFIMMTATDPRKFLDVARAQGVTHYLLKPFSIDMLADRIGSVRAAKRAV